MNIAAVHERLLRAHGLQGWWPLLELAGTPESASADASAQYHPGDYSYPRTKRQQFEIGAGAVLTQNTAWRNAEAALGALAGAGLLCPARIVRQPAVELAAVIRACGSFNVKERSLGTLLIALIWVGITLGVVLLGFVIKIFRQKGAARL